MLCVSLRDRIIDEEFRRWTEMGDKIRKVWNKWQAVDNGERKKKREWKKDESFIVIKWTGRWELAKLSH